MDDEFGVEEKDPKSDEVDLAGDDLLGGELLDDDEELAAYDADDEE